MVSLAYSQEPGVYEPTSEVFARGSTPDDPLQRRQLLSI